MSAPDSPPSPFQRHALAGFTLLELLIVIVILGILMTASVPAVDGALRASRLTSTGDNLRNYLANAQQLAITRNIEVEVRIFRSLDIAAGDTEPRARRLEVHTLQASDTDAGTGSGAGAGRYVPEGSPLLVEGSLAISTLPKFSSLLGRPFKQADADNGGATTSYISFHFYPDGSTDLPAGQPWFLTLMEERYVTRTTAPANFYTVQVHASSGKIRTFRP